MFDLPFIILHGNLPYFMLLKSAGETEKSTKS